MREEFCELMSRILNFRYYLDYSYSFAGTLESMFVCYIAILVTLKTPGDVF